MPSFQDSALLILLALVLFGPKKLPELARQLGKLMAEFRRASNEFRMQMEEELRVSDQEEQRKKIAAMEAAAPAAPVIDAGENTIAPPATEEFLVGHPHEQPQFADPLPIATSGSLNLMPPDTGLPVSNDSLSPMLDSIPQVAGHESATSDDHDAATSEMTAGEVGQRG